MDIPSWFSRALAAEFDGLLRIRWSPSRSAFQLERKNARAKFGRPPKDDDTTIRAFDGYDLVLEITPGDRVPCPKCGGTVKLKPMKPGEVPCPWCKKTFRATFWPLNDSLLQHLRFSDPDRGGIDRVFRAVDESEEKRAADNRRALRNHTEAVWKDGWTRVMDIPSVGYSGKEFRRDQDPVPRRLPPRRRDL